MEATQQQPFPIAPPVTAAPAGPQTGVDDENLLRSGHGLGCAADARPGTAPVAAAHSGRRDASQCWGQLLFGSIDCDVSDLSDRRHLQNRFCLKCRTDGIRIPAERVRVLPPELDTGIANSAAGLWLRHKSGTLPYCRVVNQTFQCSGPRLVVYCTPILSLLLPPAEQPSTSSGTASGHGQPKEQLPHNPWLPAEWPRAPAEMIGVDGCVRLVVAKGTLVPPVALPAAIDDLLHTDIVLAGLADLLQVVVPPELPELSELAVGELPAESTDDAQTHGVPAHLAHIGAELARTTLRFPLALVFGPQPHIQ
jgi:hypothetical protein